LDIAWRQQAPPKLGILAGDTGGELLHLVGAPHLSPYYDSDLVRKFLDRVPLCEALPTVTFPGF
jgi:hypothetical protein